jgi:hypothetical protein
MDIDRHRNSRARKLQRREEALARNAVSATKPYAERLADLDRSFGEGRGATKERIRLHQKLGQVLITGPSEPGQPLKMVKRKRRQRKGE